MEAIAEVLAPRVEPPAGAPSVQWLSRKILRGVNVHHTDTVVCARVRIGALAGRPVPELPANFVGGCIERFIDGAKAPPNSPQAHTLAARLRAREAMPFERLLLECLLVLERRLAFERRDFIPISKAEVRRCADEAEVELVWSSTNTAVSTAASRLAVAELDRLLGAARGPSPGSAELLDAQYAALVERCHRRDYSKTLAVLLLAAHARGLHVDLRGGAAVQFGEGALQRMSHSSITEGESMAAARLSRHKGRTSRRLTQLGIPVPRHISVQSPDEARAAAKRIGWPVVVKPMSGKQGNGVTVGVENDADLLSALERARDGDHAVLIEELAPGVTFRLLVVAGRFASALRVELPRVTGDGRRCVRELFDAFNADPLRDGVRLLPVDLDDDVLACLATAGRNLDSIPAAGEEVLLRSATNFSTGAVHTEVSAITHPAQAELAERAAAAVGLRTAGIDVVSSDISLSPRASRTRIVEVNARAGLCTHTFPRHGEARDVAGQVLDTIFAPPATGRLPTVLILGRRGTRAVTEAISASLGERGIAAGVATRLRCAIGGVPLAEGELALHEAVLRLRRDPRVEALLVATDPRRAASAGLSLRAADVVCLLARDPLDDPSEYAMAAALAVVACRGAIVAREGEAGACDAIDLAIHEGRLQPQAVHMLPRSATAADAAVAAVSMLHLAMK